MSIIGLSDRVRLPRRGKIRLGEKKISKQGKEYPSALDYFVCPEEVQEVYGEKPRKLDIMLPMENRDQFFPQAYKRYGISAGLVCRGDGEVAAAVAGEGMNEIECQGKECPHYQKGDCKQIGNLQVILPEVKGLGVYQIDTSSYNSIVNLNSGIEMIRGMLGRVSWVPLILEVQMQEAHPLVNGKRIKTIIPVMSMTSSLSVYDLLKMKLPRQQAQIDNPGVDDKPKLLYPQNDNQFAEEEREGKQIAKVDSFADPIPELTDNEAQKEQANMFNIGHQKNPGRNQLNIKWHILRKKLIDINFFGDDADYRDWLKFSFKVTSSKELPDDKMLEGIALMAKIHNEQAKKEADK